MNRRWRRRPRASLAVCVCLVSWSARHSPCRTWTKYIKETNIYQLKPQKKNVPHTCERVRRQCLPSAFVVSSTQLDLWRLLQLHSPSIVLFGWGERERAQKDPVVLSRKKRTQTQTQINNAKKNYRQKCWGKSAKKKHTQKQSSAQSLKIKERESKLRFPLHTNYGK